MWPGRGGSPDSTCVRRLLMGPFCIVLHMHRKLTSQPARCTATAPAAFDKLAETIVYYHVFNSCPLKSYNLNPSVVYMTLGGLHNKFNCSNKKYYKLTI